MLNMVGQNYQAICHCVISHSICMYVGVHQLSTHGVVGTHMNCKHCISEIVGISLSCTGINRLHLIFKTYKIMWTPQYSAFVLWTCMYFSWFQLTDCGRFWLFINNNTFLSFILICGECNGFQSYIIRLPLHIILAVSKLRISASLITRDRPIILHSHRDCW